jgi:isocitrate/isopropylmalate dehydrogenase
VNVELRKQLDLYASRPVKTLPGIKAATTGGPDRGRENTEDLYSGLEHAMAVRGGDRSRSSPRRPARGIALRLVRAKTHDRKRVSAVHRPTS